MAMNFDDWAREIHETSVEKGFWEPNNDDTHVIFYLKQIAMIHSEATEVLEALRKDKGQEAVVEELCDIIIRVLDLWAGLDANGVTTSSLEQTLINKMAINRNRERLHGVKG